MLVHRYPAIVPATQPETAVRITPRMWRQILTRPLLAPGSSVLVAGEHPHDATELLVDLAYEVTGLCAQPDDVFAGRRRCPQADFHLWPPGQRGAPTSGWFDLVLAFDLASHGGNLYQPTARLETAQLLAALKPASRLVILAPREPERLHSTECWRRHLACFPGDVTTELLSDGWLKWLPWRAVHSQGTLPDVLAITLRTPEESISAETWKRYARTGLLTGRRTCCAAAANVSSTTTAVPKAA